MHPKFSYYSATRFGHSEPSLSLPVELSHMVTSNEERPKSHNTHTETERQPGETDLNYCCSFEVSRFIVGRAAICRRQLEGIVISHITAALQSHFEPALERCLPPLWHLVLSTGCTWSEARAAEHQSQAELLISPRQTRCNICNSRDIPRMMRRKETGVSREWNWNSFPQN